MKNKNDLIECLKSIPVVQIACQKTGISRATYYRWRKENSNFKKRSNIAKKNGNNFINDLAEYQIINHIKEGNLTAGIFWLKNHHETYSDQKAYFSKNEKEKIFKMLDDIKINNPSQIVIKKLINGEISKSAASSIFSTLRKSVFFGRETGQYNNEKEFFDLLEGIIDDKTEDVNTDIDKTIKLSTGEENPTQ